MVGAITINVPGSQVPTLDPNLANTQQTGTTAGAGNAASSNGPVPDVAQAAAQTGKAAVVLGFQVMMQSLTALMPKMSSEDEDALVADVAAKLKDAQSKSNTDKINADEKTKEAAFAEQKKQLDDAAKKIQDAINEMSGPFGWLKRIFSAIFSLIQAVVGAMLEVVAPGNPLGLLLLAGGIDGAMKAIDPHSKGLMGELVKAFGGSDDAAQKAEMGFGIAVAAIMLIGSIAMCCIPGGQAAGVEGIVGATGELAAEGAEIGETAASVAETADAAAVTAQSVKTVVNGVQVTMTVMNTVVDVGDAAVNYDASNKQADAANEKANAKREEALIAQLDGLIDIAMAMLMNAQKGFNNMIDNAIDAMNDKGATMAHAKL